MNIELINTIIAGIQAKITPIDFTGNVFSFWLKFRDGSVFKVSCSKTWHVETRFK